MPPGSAPDQRLFKEAEGGRAFSGTLSLDLGICGILRTTMAIRTIASSTDLLAYVVGVMASKA